MTNCITVHAADPPPARKVIIDNDDLEYLGNKEVNEVVTAAWEIYNEQKLFDQKNALVNKISCSTRIHNNDHIQWGHKSYADGEYAGDLKNGLRDGLGKHVMAGGVFEGCWKNDLEDGQGIFIDHSDDSIYFGTWVGGERRGRGVQLKHGSMERYSYHENGEINKIEKMSLLYNNKGQTIGADNGSREKRAVLETVSYISTGRAEEHRYFLASRDSSRQKPLTVNYENINHLLNLDKVGELNDLIRKGAIAGVGDFSELKSYARDLVEDILYGGGIICRDGGSRFMVLPSSNGRAVMMGSDESYLLLLASIKSVDDLKRIRFQMVGTLWREGTMTKESYRDIRFFRESTGTLEITDQAADEYLAIIIGGSIPHAASAIVDIKKIREMDPDFGNERFFYIYDSLRN
ncbi:MAG: hypothetical protein LBB24_03695, partial [Rickettsiales bacterium]|nr:hypothetical protein [Rickettsiales bacterium]